MFVGFEPIMPVEEVTAATGLMGDLAVLDGVNALGVAELLPIVEGWSSMSGNSEGLESTEF